MENLLALKEEVEEVSAAWHTEGFWSCVLSDFRAWAKLWYPQNGAALRLCSVISAKLLWNQCGLRATLLYRISHTLWKHHVLALPGMVSRLNITLHGFDVPAAVDIGPGLYVPHPVGTVIAARRIGANASLISGITIGMRNAHEFPLIGDGVFIGAGARVLGGITIGDHVSIGANAVVVKDVPAGATVVGIPAQIVAFRKD